MATAASRMVSRVPAATSVGPTARTDSRGHLGDDLLYLPSKESPTHSRTAGRTLACAKSVGLAPLVRDAHLARDLAIAFPVRDLVGDQWIVYRRLHVPVGSHRTGGDGMFAGRGL